MPWSRQPPNFALPATLGRPATDGLNSFFFSVHPLPGWQAVSPSPFLSAPHPASPNFWAGSLEVMQNWETSRLTFAGVVDGMCLWATGRAPIPRNEDGVFGGIDEAHFAAGFEYGHMPWVGDVDFEDAAFGYLDVVLKQRAEV